MKVRATYYPAQGLVEEAIYVEVAQPDSPEDFSRCVADFNLDHESTVKLITELALALDVWGGAA